ncbi:DUF5683 domain-containing protein [Dyadobacter sp. CY356]|uniref:DUF5683 domain-containing protein n=1 Tax=Dyadobacter sp. CY356 TaxID=2906442 RepID=UPI001F36B509|nr:DUF5683 domain-containing protein [Dyadobacter sp. CY356]MCF0055749.1 DUF5683 domain-containing protein [Dyadobacter sp. CY356]
MKKWFWIGMFILIIGKVSAQKTEKVEEKDRKKPERTVVFDSTAFIQGDSVKPQIAVEKKKFIPNPGKATKLAALIPGSGQIYNRDYWKVPLVYAALAGGTWTAIYWNVRYKDFLRGYESFYDLSDKTSTTYGQLKSGLTSDSRLPIFYRGGILNGQRVDSLLLTIDQVKREKNTYRRYKETAIVFTVALYALSIIEANVAAHLKTFDLSEDISMKVAPKIQQPNMTLPTPGVSLVFNLHRRKQ